MSTIETTAKIEPMEASAYHAMKPHVSQSMLKDFGNRRRLYEGYYVTGRISRPEPTAPMEIGTACHAACLEPTRKVCVEIPDELLSKGAIRTDECKSWIEEQKAIGLIPLKASQLNTVDRVRDSFMNAAKCLLELRNSKVCVEHSMTWTDEATGLLCKARPDWLVETKKCIYLLDLKTCNDASPDGFARAMGNMDYGIQRAHYLAGARAVFDNKPAEFYFVASEVVEPFASAVYHAVGNRFDSAELRREKLMQDLAECLLRNDFKEPWEGIVNELDLPRWAERDVE